MMTLRVFLFLGKWPYNRQRMVGFYEYEESMKKLPQRNLDVAPKL